MVINTVPMLLVKPPTFTLVIFESLDLTDAVIIEVLLIALPCLKI